MSLTPRRHPMIEGRRGSRIDSGQGGRYLRIPRIQPVRAFTTVQRTGGGTLVSHCSPRTNAMISAASDSSVVPMW